MVCGDRAYRGGRSCSAQEADQALAEHVAQRGGAAEGAPESAAARVCWPLGWSGCLIRLRGAREGATRRRARARVGRPGLIWRGAGRMQLAAAAKILGVPGWCQRMKAAGSPML